MKCIKVYWDTLQAEIVPTLLDESVDSPFLVETHKSFQSLDFYNGRTNPNFVKLVVIKFRIICVKKMNL
jgi:hypothetical protein